MVTEETVINSLPSFLNHNVIREHGQRASEELWNVCPSCGVDSGLTTVTRPEETRNGIPDWLIIILTRHLLLLLVT